MVEALNTPSSIIKIPNDRKKKKKKEITFTPTNIKVQKPKYTESKIHI